MRREAQRWTVLGVCLLAAVAAGCSDSADQLHSADPAARIEAIRSLAQQGTDAAADEIARTAAQADEATAGEAVRGLGRIETQRALGALVAVAESDARPRVRTEAAVQLGYRRDARAAEALGGVLRADRDARVRAAAAASLGKLGRLQDVELLVQAAETDPDVAVQCAAVRALERVVRLGFLYDPTAPAEERQQALARVRSRALRTAAVMGQARKEPGGGP
jgi:HEAT repeat protein